MIPYFDKVTPLRPADVRQLGEDLIGRHRGCGEAFVNARTDLSIPEQAIRLFRGSLIAGHPGRPGAITLGIVQIELDEEFSLLRQLPADGLW